MEKITNMEVSKYMDEILTLSISYAPKVLLAIITLILGLWIINRIVKGAHSLMTKREVDPSLSPFLKSLLSTTLKVLLIISVISMIGVEMTSFIALLGTAGLAIGLALQGTLQNLAGGVIILLLKPFKVGDVIDAKGYFGVVKEIRVFYTLVNTLDKKLVYIPNGVLANTDLTNISEEDTRRNEWIFGISYGDDYDVAKSLIEKLISEDDRILTDPEPMIALKELGNSSVNIVVRAWSHSANLWPVFFDMNERVYKEFPKNGLTIPFPQMDVHVQNQ